MLLFLLLSSVVRPTVANRFFNNCPMDIEQRFDNDRVIDVLHTFYKDLSFVKASTESEKERNFDDLLEELRGVGPFDARFQQIRYGIKLLGKFNLIEGGNVIGGAANEIPPSLFTYIKYFAVELYRVSGRISHALRQFEVVSSFRRESVGISLNELERLDGLIVLQRVLKFNQDVNKLYRFSRGKSFDELGKTHSDLKDKTSPFREWRTVELRSMFGESNQIIPALSRREIGNLMSSLKADGEIVDDWQVDPVKDVLRVKSVAKTYAEDILCEFARKLAVLVSDTGADGRTNYRCLDDQIREIHEDSADVFHNAVERNIANIDRQHGASIYLNAYNYRSLFHVSDDVFESLKTYANYYEAEMSRYKNTCYDILDAERLLDSIKRNRYSTRGVSLDKLFELEGRIVFKLIKCFHDRLISIYRLNGDECERELEDKRARFGNCDNFFPR